MHESAELEYGKPPRPFRGSGRRPVLRLRKTALLNHDERVKAKFRAAREKAGTAPSRAFQEICEGNQKPLSSAAKRALELVADGRFSVDEIMELGSLDRSWVEEQVAQLRHVKPAA